MAFKNNAKNGLEIAVIIPSSYRHSECLHPKSNISTNATKSHYAQGFSIHFIAHEVLPVPPASSQGFSPCCYVSEQKNIGSCQYKSVADLDEGGANPKGGSANYFLGNFSQNFSEKL